MYKRQVYNISSDEELLNLKGCTLLVPSEGMENYKSTYPWSQIKDIVENTERDNIKSIGNFDEDKLKSSLQNLDIQVQMGNRKRGVFSFFKLHPSFLLFQVNFT